MAAKMTAKQATSLAKNVATTRATEKNRQREAEEKAHNKAVEKLLPSLLFDLRTKIKDAATAGSFVTSHDESHSPVLEAAAHRAVGLLREDGFEVRVEVEEREMGDYEAPYSVKYVVITIHWDMA